MRNEVIDAPNKQVIGDPFHGLQAFVPTVGAECFAHGAPIFVLCQMRCRSAQFGQGEMIEFAVAAACLKGIMMERHSRNHLRSYDIDSGKMLRLLRPEEVAGAIAESGVRAIILNIVS
ncbi:hypothetical protein SDC9_202741 [bioreactor metagenome]|uniref:Uncharacterized protein n=1 Tax=bioreactor metagenome TaxID=1076179 RepID=A0A645IW19_9ZZZZ